ncbi:MAG: MmgE/PrpD family protein [Candidatus Contendobacter odensis]|uniref:MmgE/PrpD family protein n=1 Tax=Candidatus Contendibacter odensensis TaxID=1400860 RepID=A0A2G6PFH5_9GAMM|nr:MAG: MmgE/PrpD family protein [Candidatus Contendobacter odensis]
MTKPTLTQQLVELIINKPVATADLEQAALLTLDALANTLAGQSSNPGRILLRWAGEQAALDTARYAFLLGALTHVLETDDLHRASVVHPGCVVIPAAWAIADREAIRGRAVLKAVLWGFEAATRVGMAVGPAHYRLWHNTATCGPYGSAMATAALLGLELPMIVHALGNAGTQSAGLWQFLEAGTMTKHLHAGRAAEAGVLAADLARYGFTGPPAILEGAKGWFAAACPDADPEAVIRDPDAPWQLLQTSIKPWPSCRHTHPVIDAAHELRRSLIAGTDTIEHIEIETYPAALDVCDRPAPATDYEAKFSLQHCVAVSLKQDNVDFAAFSEPARVEMAGLRERVSLRASEPYASAYPHAWGCAVTVTVCGGEQFVVRRDHARGDPEAPLTPIEQIDKARILMTYGGVSDPNRLINEILALSDNGRLPDLGLND